MTAKPDVPARPYWPRSIGRIAALAGWGIVALCCAGAPTEAVLAQSTKTPAARGSIMILPDSDQTVQRPADSPSQNPADSQSTAVPSISRERIELLNSSIKLDNPAGISLELIPSLEVASGTRIGFRVTSHHTGYLILLDIDATGKLTQIFPTSAPDAPASRDVINLIRPGRTLTLPQLGTPFATFEFVADPPTGIAMVFALFSDRPVQVVDLPDTPPPGTTPVETMNFIRDQARTLRIPNPNNGALSQPNWSFDGKFYLIK